MDPTSRDDWDRHWTDYNEATERNPAQAFRHRTIMRLLAREGGATRLVDIGSGQGDLAALIQRSYKKSSILGLEYSEAGVNIASRKVPEATFMKRDLMVPAAPPGEYREWGRQAVCSEVLEHVDKPVLVLRQARRYLARGCFLVVTVPGGPMSAFDHHIGHRRHFPPAYLSSILTRAGYEVDACFGAGFPFFNLYRLAVIARGGRLTEDVSQAGGISSPARAAMAIFDPLLHLTLERSPWGWQTIGVARVPEA